MKIKFIVNDYIYIWNLLFSPTDNEDIEKEKTKLWNTYRDEYNSTYYDRDLILKDYKNFIPNNDTIYNGILNSKIFNTEIKKLEKDRVKYTKLWDKNIKKIDVLFKKNIRMPFSDYNCFVLDKNSNKKEIISDNDKKCILLGCNYEDENDYIIDIIYEIVKKEIKIKEEDTIGIKDAIIEMCVLNEFATNLKKESCYKNGSANLYELKKQIYPYWLMYLGVKRDDMVKYMMRDKIAFEVGSYAYEKELVNLNLAELIDFIIRNRRYIIRSERDSIQRLDESL